MDIPTQNRYHAAILNAFDKKQISTIGDIEKHLKEVGLYQSYASTRRALIALEKKKIIFKLPTPGGNNASLYTKNVFKNYIAFTKPDGTNATLRGYINYVMNYENPLMSPKAIEAVKFWILDSLASPVAEAYTSKNRSIPNREEHRIKLQGTLRFLTEFHALVKGFLDSQAWNDVGYDLLREELTKNCVEELEMIVDRAYLNNEEENRDNDT